MIEDALPSANPLRRQRTARIQHQAGLVPTSRDLACSTEHQSQSPPVVAGKRRSRRSPQAKLEVHTWALRLGAVCTTGRRLGNRYPLTQSLEKIFSFS